MTSLGLPDTVVDFLKSKTEEDGLKFKWKILCSDDGFSEVTLSWIRSSETDSAPCINEVVIRQLHGSLIKKGPAEVGYRHEEQDCGEHGKNGSGSL